MRDSRTSGPIIGIKRETVNLWEQRSPLIPEQVKQLVEKGVRVLVQPSNRRCFTAAEYEAAGATMSEDLSDASVILGVKRPTQLRPTDLLANKTYAFFTHTIKAQPENMALLDTLLARKIRMLDYECMKDNKNQRLVAFGKFAGQAGTIDILHGLGIRLLAMGHSTPFLKISMAHNYNGLAEAKERLRLAAYSIARGGMPDSIGPLVFVIHGDGNVAQGAQSIIDCLPVQYIQPEQLATVSQTGTKNVIYACVVNVSHYMERRDGQPFSFEDYFKQPEKYKSRFIDKIAPYTSVLINATYWDARVDRILTRENVKPLLNHQPAVKGSPKDEAHPTLPQRLLAICDISADLGGSVEFTDECTTVDEPFVLYNIKDERTTKGIVGDGVLMCSIDNMPTQLPFEASEHFGNVLFPYLTDIIRSDATKPFSQYDAMPEVRNAMITSNGELTPDYKYIEELRGKQKSAGISSTTNQSKNVLILGAGYVVPSVLDYLSRDKTIQLTVASNIQEELSEITAKYPKVQAQTVDVLQDQTSLRNLVANNDLVISLIPWKHHPTVIEECIHQKRNVLTASYCTPVLKEMESRIQDAGITALMEVGLDPGIDHLLTKECIDDTVARGGRVISYRSFTGGLPAPENSDNPLRYKFSWSPEAAMSTVMNGAKYLENGQIKEIKADGSLMAAAGPMDVFPGFNLEGYPNRDSTRYIDLYGIQGCETVVRGTLRYRGYSQAVSLLLRLGLLDGQKPHPELQKGSPSMSWRQFICHQLKLDKKLTGEALNLALMKAFEGDLSKFLCLSELGLLSEDPVVPLGTTLASTSAQLAKTMTYGPTERDLIIMAHELVIDWPSQNQQELRKVSLVSYGNAGQGKAGLAMSRTVGIPTAIAAKMILDGEIPDKGIVLPLKPHIYKPMLQRLEEEGIRAQETSKYFNKCQ